MEDGRITGEVSIDRRSDGTLLVARDQIVISDDAGDVICLVPYEPGDDECMASKEYERLADTIVARLNAHDALRQMLANYLQMMEDYSAGIPLTDPQHNYHEDWTAARALAKLLDGGAR